MNKKSIILIILVLICLGIVAFIYLPDILPTSPLEISNIHAEKSKTTWDYASGKHEESTKIIITYHIDNPQDIKNGILTQWIGYDKKGKVIFNETVEESLFVDYNGGYYEFDEEANNLDNLDKVVKLELNIYKNIPQETNELYGNMITSKSYGDLLFHGETKNITYTGETNHDVDDTPKPTKHREVTERDIIEMDTEAYMQADVGDYYLGHDENGNLKRYEKHDPIFG